MTTDHIDLESLSAFTDGDLNAVSALRVERHVAACAECRRSLDRMRALVASARGLPREVSPPPEAWTAIRARIPVPGSRFPVFRPWWHSGGLASAAGVVLVVGTATLMLLLRPDGKAKAAKLASLSAGGTAPIVLASVERNYAPTLEDLRDTFESQRSALSPTTVRTLEHSLAVIDSAIAEARSALQADPGSAALIDLLSFSYQRKVEFLRRAASLTSSL